MLCKIADLWVEISETGDMLSRCRDYLADEEHKADISISSEDYSLERWKGLSENNAVYMETANAFYCRILEHGGMMLHASAIEYRGRAYLFSGPSGMGKSTHTRLWQEIFPDVKVFNDDKPALRYVDGKWYAYGTPWCGKDGININMKVPLAGICFLKRGDKNIIRRLSKVEAIANVLAQTVREYADEEHTDMILSLSEKLIQCIPIFELRSIPVPDAARLSCETMCLSAEEGI